ncbi:2-octaprenyl-6-methoxyphenyl hydroxylase [Methylotetracoccus oryzae]|uniref:2-octaprenyl-6-methoxyphenyl hydroxylase n=1 Tax=Methylotetracoccus oryzae TaxID=1919059 RepID=UPI001117DB17|nr:2-octaprenyl-6-methoxyphenyl hydroxylase [Methylotetracoccus oryzae]
MNGFDYDLVIIGGGLVGSSLALALRNAPLRIAIVDAQSEAQRRASPAGARALALAEGSVQILQRLGVWAAIEPDATPIRHIHVSDRGHFGKTRLDAEREGVKALGHVATARAIEEAVIGALHDAPADLLEQARLIGLKAGDDRICVTLRQGDDTLNLTTRLVVGADGGDSSVRKLLDIGSTARDYGQTAIVLEVATERDHRNTAYERFTASGPLAMLPIDRKRCSVVWTLSHHDAEDVRSLPEAQFLATLQETFGHWVGRLSIATPRQAFPLKLIRADRMTDRRVVLIGNAVHQLHPVAGQGFNLGLRDAAQLAEGLIGRTEFGEDIGSAGFLEAYAASRSRDLQNVVFFTDSLVRLFSNRFAPLALARNLGLVALDCWPAAKQRLASHAMGLARRIPRMPS